MDELSKEKSEEKDETAENLYEAIKNRRDIETIKRLAKINSEKINTKYDAIGNTSLILAVQLDCDIDVIKALLENNAKVNVKNDSGNTVLFYAVSKSSCNEEIVKLLVEAGADINSQNIVGESIFRRLVVNGNEKLIEYFLEQKGLKINIVNKSGRTPLSYVLDELLNVFFSNKSNKNWLNIKNLLLKHNAKLGDNKHDNNLLINAVKEKSLRKIKTYIECGINVNSIDSESSLSALQLAIKNGQKDIANALIEAGANKEKLTESEKQFLNSITV